MYPPSPLLLVLLHIISFEYRRSIHKCIHRFVPESPRWLMAEGRFEEAIKILKSGAKCNDRTLPSDDELLEMMQAIKEDVSILLSKVLDTFLL